MTEPHTVSSMIAPQLLRLLPVLAVAATQRPTRAVVFAARHPVVAARTARLVKSLPWVDVPLTTQPAGRTIRSRVERRRYLLPVGRLARATLTLPDEAGLYLRGRHRQAARTNIARAARNGVSAAEVPPDGLANLAAHVTRAGWREHLDWVARTLAVHRGQGVVCVVVTDADRCPVAVAAAVADAQVAQLVAHASDPDHPESRDGRYVATDGLVRALVARHVRLLLGGSALTTSQNLAYFQHLQGFAPHNLRVLAVR